MQWRVQEIWAIYLHICALFGHVQKTLSAQTCLKMTNSTDNICDETDTSNKCERDGKKEGKSTSCVDVSSKSNATTTFLQLTNAICLRMKRSVGGDISTT